MSGASALINRFARAVATYEASAVVQRLAAERLAERLGGVCHLLAPRILEIGCGTGLLSRRLMARFSPSELVLNDLCPDMGICFANVPRTLFLAGDGRALVWPGMFDVVASASAIQWFGDLGAFSRRCAAVLPKGGFLAVSCFGPATLQEVRALSGAGLDYPSFEQFGAVLGADFEPLVVERGLEELYLESGAAVLRHLKATGVTATGAGEVWTRGRLAAFVEAYERRFAVAGGGVRVTYEPFWFVGVRR